MSVRAICLNFQRSLTIRSGPVNHDGIRWIQPSQGSVKVNVDASFHTDSYDGATGVVIRDSSRMFLAAACLLVPHIPEAHTAETLALKHGLELANEMGFHSIQIESESIEVIDAYSGLDRIWNATLAIYADCFILAKIE